MLKEKIRVYEAERGKTKHYEKSIKNMEETIKVRAGAQG